MEEKLKQFLEENKLEIQTKIQVNNLPVYYSLNPDIIKLVLSCIVSTYEVKDVQ